MRNAHVSTALGHVGDHVSVLPMFVIAALSQ
jgi:hypothetical protein